MKKNNNDNMLPSHNSCPGHIQIPTEREQKALKALLNIKIRVRQIRQSLKKLPEQGKKDDQEARKALEQELRELKESWDKWEDERKAAAKEMMVLLGHETND